jgi:hypothetical protein
MESQKTAWVSHESWDKQVTWSHQSRGHIGSHCFIQSKPSMLWNHCLHNSSRWVTISIGNPFKGILHSYIWFHFRSIEWSVLIFWSEILVLQGIFYVFFGFVTYRSNLYILFLLEMMKSKLEMIFVLFWKWCYDVNIYWIPKDSGIVPSK